MCYKRCMAWHILLSLQLQLCRSREVRQWEWRRRSTEGSHYLKKPPGSYGWLEWMEPEDLTNSILVSLLNVFISTLTICVQYCLFIQLEPNLSWTALVEPLYSTSWWSLFGSAFSNGMLLLVTLNGGLVYGSLTVWGTARITHFVKAALYVLPSWANKCAGKHIVDRNVCME